MMRTIGAISDTHGLLRPQALAALAGCDPIIHAGDVGSPDVLARLGALVPVHAVRGNVDHGAWSANLPVTQRIEIDGFRIYVLHILAELDPQVADNVDAVILDHTGPHHLLPPTGVGEIEPSAAINFRHSPCGLWSTTATRSPRTALAAAGGGAGLGGAAAPRAGGLEAGG